MFFLQAEDGIRDLVRSRGLGDVYKRQSDNMGTAFNNCLSATADDSIWRNTSGMAINTPYTLSLIHI